MNIYPAYGSNSCSPGWTTLEAYVDWTDPSVTNGEFRWYASETSTDILYSSPCYNDGATSQYSLYASQGQSVYVCIYNYYTGCETNREQYYFSFPAPPSGYIEYARDCGFGATEIKTINTSNFGVYFELVKYNNYGNWDYVTSNYTGEFSAQGLDPYGQYAIRLNSGNYCGTSTVLPFSIDYSDPAAPTVYGNVGTCEGRSAEVIATGPHQSIFWYDAAGNFLEETSHYFTPTNLTAGTYTYIARGGNSSGCRSNPASIVVNVNLKPVDGTITASTTTACVGQLVTIANQGGVGTPHYWGSSDGGQTWNLFADGHVGESNFQFTPSTPGTYRFHVRNQTVCGFCWDQPGGCTTFPYVDITVVTPPPVTVSVSSPTFGQGETKLTPSITGSSYQWMYNGADIPGATERMYAAGKSGNYSVRVTSGTGCISVSPPVAVTVNNNNNYIITNNIRKPGVTTNDQVGALSAAENFQNIAYLDGVGRTIQEVVTQGSPGNQDAITFVEYDAINRSPKAYLPYTSGTDGSVKPDPVSAQAAFFQNLKGDSHAYAESRLENSPSNRPVEQAAPGTSWQIGSGHTQTITYTKNVWGEVRIWNYAPATQTASGTSSYNDNELFVTQVISDQGQKSLEYKNKSGQVVCTKVQKTPGDDINYFVTYFVYDDLQNMRFKITPEAVNNLAAINYTFSYNDNFTKQWLFAYQYDESNRQITKRKPGAGEEFIVYDNLDRVVFTQDANMRAKAQPQWQATLYDVLSRPVITGLVTHTATLTDMQTAADTRTSDLPIGSPGTGGDITLYQPSAGTYQASNSITMIAGFSTTGDFVAEIVPAADGPQISIIDGVAVSKNPLPPGAPFEILTVTYYDDYNWVAGTGTTLSSTIDGTYLNNSNYFITSSTAPEYAQPIQANYHVRGNITGAKTKIVGTTNQYLYAVTFYDTEGRSIQVQSINQSGGKDITTTQYDFTGKLLRSLDQFEKKAGTTTTNYLVLKRMEYTLNGLPYKTWKKIGTDPEHLVNTYTYSENGDVKTKTLGNGLESLNYDYNMRGWLTTVNKDYLTAPDNTPPTHWFAMELGYENSNSVVSNTSYNNPRFNGAVTGTVWKSRGAGVRRKFDYTYDNIDRLTAAGFKEQFGNAWANTDPVNQNFTIDFGIGGKGNSNQFIEYDDNGNIKNCWQKGLKVNSSANIDDLVYEYISGNQLGKVSDGQNDPTTKLGDFHDGGNAGYDYDYDPNGNLTKDENKKITSITYNHLSLPQVITFANSNGTSSTITYTYDATGSRQKKVVVDKSTTGKTVTITTTYLFGGVYESRTTVNPAPTDPADYTDELRYLKHEEGRMRWVPGTSGTAGSFVFDYFIVDNLGNVRTILTEEQKTDPYPMASMEDVVNKNDLNDPKNYIPYYANSDYTTDGGVRYAISSITDYPNTADANVTAPNQYVARLNGNGKKIGPSVVLKVMAGDQFNLQVSSWYKTNGVSPDVPANPLSDLVTILANSAGSISGKLSPADLQNSNFLGPNITKFLDGKTVLTDRPKAYVNWVLFDEQFRYVQSSSSFEQVPVETDFQNNVHWHQKTNLPVTKSGYLYVYVSNETPNIDVFFDNLQVTHIHGPLLEENHYYPMGLPMAGICSHTLNGLAANKLKYQGKELEEDLGLNLYDFHARQYDAQIGRFHVPDPANQFASPYLGMGNSWPNGTDPDGRIFGIDDAIIGGMIIGAALSSATYVAGNFMNGGTWKDLNFKDWSKAAAMGAVSGAMGAGFVQAGPALVGKELAQSMGYQMFSNIATQVGVNVAFGNRITIGTIIGAAIGGAIDGAIPQFTGIAHSGITYGIMDGIKNGIAELAYNTARGALVGGISGGLGAMIDGGDIGQGTVQGMRAGALSGGVRTAMNLAFMGPAIVPNDEARKEIQSVEKMSHKHILSGAAAPVFRVGGILKLFTPGITIGRSVMVNGRTHAWADVKTWVHEVGHVLQQFEGGYEGQLFNGIKDQWFGKLFHWDWNYDPYGIPGTNEYDADHYIENLQVQYGTEKYLNRPL